MTKRRNIVGIEEINEITIEDTKERLKTSQTEQNKMIIKEKEFREKDLFDFYSHELPNEIKDEKKRRKKISLELLETNSISTPSII